jgi:hypothetical protein
MVESIVINGYLFNRTMKTGFLLLLILVHGAVSAEFKRIVLASGDVGYSIRCDNENVNSCYEKAGEACPHGYTTESENLERGYRSDGTAFVSPLPGGAIGGVETSSSTTTEKGMVIQCKDPELTEKEHQQRALEMAQAERARKDEEQRQFETGAKGARWFFGGFFAIVAVIAIGAIIAVNR